MAPSFLGVRQRQSAIPRGSPRPGRAPQNAPQPGCSDLTTARKIAITIRIFRSTRLRLTQINSR
ncbi:MAG: hypothetical protein WB420_11525, partial [Bradyrhizobium sp.]